MDDAKIVELYFERSEEAIAQTRNKYEKYCFSIARSILSSDEDAAECVNDTYLKLWSSIPPARPEKLGAFAGRITRNLALNRYDYNKAGKRTANAEIIIDEFFEVIAEGSMSVEDEVALKGAINGFLSSLEKRDRIIFMKRYWYGMGIKELAAQVGVSENAAKLVLFRTRNKFRAYLKKEGIIV